MGDVIVLSILGIIVALVVRSMWMEHKKGGGCSGCGCDCARCSSHCNRSIERK